MRILYVVSRPLQINTSASVRNRATIAGLLENGHKVNLVTTMPDEKHMSFDDSMELHDIDCKYIELQGVQSIAKVGRRLKFLKPIYKFAIKLIQGSSIYDNLVGIVDHINEIDLRSENYDLIISSSDPKSSHLFVEKLLDANRDVFKGKWIQIWGDPFLDDITLADNIDRQKVYAEEKRLLEAADKIIYVSKLTLQRQQSRFATCSDKMYYYPIPYNKEIITTNRNLKKCGIVNLAYCGDYISTTRNILPLYDAVNDLSNIHLTIYGMSDLKLKCTESVLVKPRQKQEAVFDLEKECDILVHLSNLRGSQIPGKLYQYSGTNKPILFILDGDSEPLEEEFKRYNRYVFAHNNANDIKKMIEGIITDSKTEKPVTDFSKKVITSKIISI